MSILTKDIILKTMTQPLEQRLIVTPILDQKQIGESSVDVRLGNEFILIKKRAIKSFDISQIDDIKNQVSGYQEKIRIEMQREFILHPNQFALASTLEYIVLPNNIACYVIGRSSWGRLGLIIATATAISPGFKGCVTFEMVNIGEAPLVLFPGLRIAQLVFHHTDGISKYDGRYLCPTGPQFSKIHLDEELKYWVKK